MVKPASPRWLRQPITAIAILLIGSSALAQQAPKPPAIGMSEPGFDEPMFLPEDLRPPEDTLTVGLRFSSRTKVVFTGLGTLTSRLNPGVWNDSTIKTRSYVDGVIEADTRTRLDGTPVNDGLTNAWTYTIDADLVDDKSGLGVPGSQAIALHNYHTESSGALASAKSGGSVGWDIEYSHRLGGNKVIWGLLFGGGLADIDATANVTGSTNLRIITHYYSLYGAPAPERVDADPTDTVPAEYNAPAFKEVIVYDENGNPVLGDDGQPVKKMVDNTTLLSQQPYDGTSTLGKPIEFTGRYNIKGAGVTARMGPYLQTALSKHVTLRASAGVTFTLIGARIRFEESAVLKGSAEELVLTREEDSNTSATFGAFASAEVNWMLTRRTGFFFGGVYEKYSGAMDIEVAPAPTPESVARKASITTTGGLGLRFGLTSRF